MGKDQKPFHAFALTSAIISYLSGCTLVGIFFGRWIDQKLGLFPTFLIVGLFIGLGVGVYGTINLVNKYTGDN
ncbi:Putative F0F1-ATPase subunit Ca2+/Mg2+ transporter [Salinibacillus kushneri]|uniref:Putative F0F1-ATPase subunit Ca2+/Mg2+ transporter n=1 Tax=Salinibacillus kushneri TaxID=237682 RepID=A0A1I0CWD2_9BACI|nr:AtpZ/AtpI family protein [Salinibacillus kushneri]SET24145.1 Putative F0F1-ATPase subunit Ca2+/Mg2+ transporter [Salinibacillus kushneri]